MQSNMCLVRLKRPTENKDLTFLESQSKTNPRWFCSLLVLYVNSYF